MMKLLRTFLYLITGRINRIADVWGKNSDVISARYDKVVDDKRKRLQSYKDAIAQLAHNEQTKKDKLANLTKETEELSRLQSGALAKAKSILAGLNGDVEAAKLNPDYIRCQTAYKDFKSTLDEKQKRAEELETEIKGHEKQLTQHKAQIESLKRDLDAVKDEKYETIADVQGAEETRRVADVFSGISEDKTDRELQELREVRSKARASARMSEELAGMDAKNANSEFAEWANAASSDDEFERLLGVTKEVEVPVKTEPTPINE